MAATIEQILATECRGTFIGFGGIELIVNSRGWNAGDDEAAIIAGELPATRYVLATQDGRHIDIRGWHAGASENEVYYERYSPEGREAHGWIDAETRLLTQAG